MYVHNSKCKLETKLAKQVINSWKLLIKFIRRLSLNFSKTIYSSQNLGLWCHNINTTNSNHKGQASVWYKFTCLHTYVHNSTELKVVL